MAKVLPLYNISGCFQRKRYNYLQCIRKISAPHQLFINTIYGVAEPQVIIQEAKPFCGFLLEINEQIVIRNSFSCPWFTQEALQSAVLQAIATDY